MRPERRFPGHQVGVEDDLPVPVVRVVDLLLNPLLESLGFDLSTEELDPADPRWRYDERWQARTLSLMEHLTGVRMSRDLLADATFRCAAVPDPGSLAWMRANPTRIGPWTVEELAVEARGRLAAYAADPDRDDEDDDWADDDDWAEQEPHAT